MDCSTDCALEGSKQQHKSVNTFMRLKTCNPEIRSGMKCERSVLRQKLKKHSRSCR